MPVVRDENINNDLVINKVEKKPALFNKTLKNNSNANLKFKMREENRLNTLSTI